MCHAWLVQNLQLRLVVMQSLQDVTGAEFKMFMDFLKSLALFGDKASTERVQELLEIVEGQADLDAVFNVRFIVSFHLVFYLPILFMSLKSCILSLI